VSVTTSGALTINSGGVLRIDNFSAGGSSVTIGAAVTNSGFMQIGNSGMTAAPTVKETGSFNNTGGRLILDAGNSSAAKTTLNVSGFTNTGGSVGVFGGSVSGANGLLDISGAMPSTLVGSYTIQSNAASAAVEYGSGGVTSIGDGSSHPGSVTLSGKNAFLEVGAVNSNNSLTGLTTIASNGELDLDAGESVTTSGALSINSGGLLRIDNFSAAAGSSLKSGGSLTNAGYLQIGNSGIMTASTVNVTGTFTNTGGRLVVDGGNVTAGSALLNVSGAASGTLTGSYVMNPNGGSAAVEWGSGGVTSIGDGSSHSGSVALNGKNAFLKIGAAPSNSALTTLSTIASNGELDMDAGVPVTTSGALTINSGGVLRIDNFSAGGSSLTSKGSLTNNGYLQVGNSGLSSPATLNVAAALTNGGNGSVVVDGGNTGGNAVINMTGPTIANAGSINLNGNIGNDTLQIGANVTASGTGAIKLSNIATNLITGTSPTFTLTNATTIQGSGTMSNMGIVNTGTIAANQSTPLLILPSSLRLNNKGTLSVSPGDTMQIGTSAGGALTNLSGTTLTGGTYTVSGTMQFGAGGTSIVTDAANITLIGASSQIIDFGSNNVLAKLATVSSGSSFNLGAARSFTTVGNFTNNGTLTVGGGDTFKVNGNLTNFSGTTLTGGTYNVGGTLSFNSANIVTNAASITLTGASSKILSNTATNALANFATNNAGATFALGAGRSFTTAGNFTNNGTLTVGSGDTFKVNGNLTNFSGTTLTGGIYNVTGTLQFNGANILTNAANITLSGTTFKILDQSSNNGIAKFANNNNFGTFALASNAALTTAGGNFTNSGTFTVNKGSTFTVGGSGFNFTQTAGTSTVDGTLQGASTGTLSLNGGSLFGGGTLGYAVTDKGIITPGDSSTKTGILTVSTTYTQNSAGALDISIGGATQGTQYDELKVTSTAALNGTLTVSLVNSFTPTVGQTFDIVHGSSLTGAFSKINGLSINGSEHFSLSQTATDIVLTVVNGAAAGPDAAIRPSLVPRWRRAVVLPAHTGPAAAMTTPAPAIVPPQPRHGSFGMAMANRIRRSDAGVSEVVPTLAAPPPSIPNSRAAFVQTPAANFSKTLGNPSRFECGVDLGALLKASPRRLWRSFVSDSPEVANIGYVAMVH
jgi:hypothetical protein